MLTMSATLNHILRGRRGADGRMPTVRFYVPRQISVAHQIINAQRTAANYRELARVAKRPEDRVRMEANAWTWECKAAELRRRQPDDGHPTLFGEVGR